MGYIFKTSVLRSELMQKIKSKKTKPEVIFRKELRKNNIRYRCYVDSLPGNPDFVLVGKRVAIFIDGEFWHGHNWKNKKKRINSNRDYWIPKIERNIKRDRNNNRKLKMLGWRVLRFWEHQIREDIGSCIKKVRIA